MASFLAIDFETGDSQPDSACSIGLVRVEDDRIVHREARLIRPPRRRILFTHVHGIRWEHVAEAPDFGALWPTIAPLFEGVDFLAAHNAAFDRRVLLACCQAYGIAPPLTEFRCTVALARRTWNFRPTNLKAVCGALDIPLNHHEALSDALACAEIVMRARFAPPVPAVAARAARAGARPIRTQLG